MVIDISIVDLKHRIPGIDRYPIRNTSNNHHGNIEVNQLINSRTH